MKMKDKGLNIKIKRGRKPETIMFIHGNSCSLKHFEKLLEAESIENSILCFDLPGHGESYRSDDTDHYSFKNYRKVIAELANEQEQDILLVGHSMGGHLAIEAAPEVNRLKGLVISGTPPIKKPANIEEAFLPFPELQYMFQEEVSKEIAEGMFSKACQNQKAVKEVLADFYRTDAKIRSKMMEDLGNGVLLDEAKIFTSLPVKKFVIQPSDDVTPNYDYIRGLSSDARFFEISNCGHYPSLERPEEWNRIVGEVAREVFV